VELGESGGGDTHELLLRGFELLLRGCFRLLEGFLVWSLRLDDHLLLGGSCGLGGGSGSCGGGHCVYVVSCVSGLALRSSSSSRFSRTKTEDEELTRGDGRRRQDGTVTGGGDGGEKWRS
jgi:hypothetical protein